MMGCWKKRTAFEKRSLVTLITALTFIVGLITLIVLVTEPEYCYTSSCSQASDYIRRLLKPSVNPCDNFYNFACGNALYDDEENITKTTRILQEIISESMNKNDTKSLKLQKQFYQSCIDLEAIDADNDTTFSELLVKLGGWPVVSGNNWNESGFDFAEFMVELRNRGLQHDWFLDISVHSNWGQNIILQINLPDNAYKIDEKIAKAYIDLITKTAAVFGAHDSVAKSQIPQVVHFENKLANIIEEIHNESERQAPQLITIAEVQQKWQNINWLELINHLTKKKLSENQTVAFYAEKYLPELDKLLKHTTKRTQVNYVIWKLIEAYSPFFSERIRNLVHHFAVAINQTDLWYKDREYFCFEEAKSYFQHTLEAAYLRRHVTETKRTHIKTLIDSVVEQLEKHLLATKWMDDNLKKTAIEKLRNVTYIIGGPEEMYSAERFDEDFGVRDIEFNSTNIILVTLEIFDKAQHMLYHKNYENTSFLKYTFYELVTSQKMAFYQYFNLLWIPAGLLDDFIYENDRPSYLNYGTLGSSISYQLVNSVYADLFLSSTLWANTTTQRFNAMAECFKNCTEGQSDDELNCGDNLLESLADNIAINVTFEAYMKWSKRKGPDKKLLGLDFTSNQLFWLARAASTCHSVPELNYSRHDHMMHSFKIVGPFRNSPHFNKDFHCELGSNMNPRYKCQIL